MKNILFVLLSFVVSSQALALGKWYCQHPDWHECAKISAAKVLGDKGWGHLQPAGTVDWQSSSTRFFGGNWYIVPLQDPKTAKTYTMSLFMSCWANICQPAWEGQHATEHAITLVSASGQQLIGIGYFDKRDFVLKPSEEN